jgi:glycosyltransferase involved in cell wall biosynthesis
VKRGETGAVPRPPERPPLSGVVHTFNEEENLERCLESLRFCEEIVVVDSHSTDATREIARRYTDRVIEQDFLGYIGQRKFAVAQASHEWVVCLDADEAVSPELGSEIQRAVAAAGDDIGGFELNRVTRFLGVWHDLGEWSADRVTRVLRRSRAHFIGPEPHDRIEVDGRSELLRAALWHWNYRDLSQHVRTADRFSTEGARSLREQGARFRTLDLLGRPAGRFLKGYLLKRGFRKGVPGLLVSVSTAYYVLMKYAKLWELEQRESAAVPEGRESAAVPEGRESASGTGKRPASPPGA